MKQVCSLLFALFASATGAFSATFTVINTNDSGAGSLRQAILNVNTGAGPHTINFAIPASGVQTIAPISALPAISNSVTINGYSQPGSQQNGLLNGNNATLLIRLDGVVVTNPFPAGLRFYSSGNVVRGLVILRFWDGLVFHGSSGSVVAGNFIGLDTDGLARGNADTGVYLTSVGFQLSGGNTIGGTSPADRNIISGNTYGIFIFPAAVSGNIVQGNFIGTDASGTVARGNTHGMYIQASTNNLVGGTIAARNVISGNVSSGLTVLGAFGNVIQGNYVGTDASGSADLGNFFYGIKVQDFGNNTVGGSVAGAGNLISGNDGPGLFLLGGTNTIVHGNRIGTDASGTLQISNRSEGIYVQGAQRSFIGGTGPGQANTIFFNGAAGVSIFGGDRVSVRGNRIHNNRGLGIDLGFTGILTNDVGDGDTGSNEQQNYPLLSSAVRSGPSTFVSGTLNSATNAQFIIDFYCSPTGDASGFGEGDLFVGTTTVNTDASGNASFGVTLALGIPVGFVVAATAIDTNGNTSEFSQTVVVTAPSANPSFSVTRVGGSPAFRWPSSASGYILQCTASLNPPIQWQSVTSGIQDNGTTKTYVVTNYALGTNGFYRLIRP